MLTEGRLYVEKVDREPITAERFPIAASCRGDSGEVYRLGYDARLNEWRCTCKALSDKCSHLVALKLICVKPELRKAA